MAHLEEDVVAHDEREAEQRVHRDPDASVEARAGETEDDGDRNQQHGLDQQVDDRRDEARRGAREREAHLDTLRRGDRQTVVVLHAMNLARFVSERRSGWEELDRLVVQAGRRTEKLGPLGVRRLGDLYRATAADLALARRRVSRRSARRRAGAARRPRALPRLRRAHPAHIGAPVLQARLLASDPRAARSAGDRDRAARRLGRDLGRVGRSRPGRGRAAGSVGVSRGHAAPAARLRPGALTLRAQRDVEPDLHQQHPRDPARARGRDRVRRRLRAACCSSTGSCSASSAA